LTLSGHPVGAGVVDGSLTLEACLLEDNVGVGILADGASTIAEISEVAVRGTVPDSAGNPAWGVAAQKGARIELDASALAANRWSNLVSLREGATIEVQRSV